MHVTCMYWKHACILLDMHVCSGTEWLKCATLGNIICSCIHDLSLLWNLLLEESSIWETVLPDESLPVLLVSG